MNCKYWETSRAMIICLFIWGIAVSMPTAGMAQTNTSRSTMRSFEDYLWKWPGKTILPLKFWIRVQL
jgi:hypothetical protein